jgi:ABC-2 type transport system permease protein
MRNVLAIVERELGVYFVSPIAYVVLTVFALLSGLFFDGTLRQVQEFATFNAIQTQQFGGTPQPIDVPGLISQSFMGTVSVILLFMIPMITMALFSEEKKRGTIELMLTAPVTDLQLVLGKFKAAAAFYAMLLAATWVPMSTLFIFADPAWGPIFSAYLGLLLYGLALLAIGLFLSTLTENQIIAGVLGFSVALALLVLDAFVPSGTSTIGAILSYLSVFRHLNDFMQGVLSISHVIYYLSLMTLGLFLTYRSIESIRWRG